MYLMLRESRRWAAAVVVLVALLSTAPRAAEGVFPFVIEETGVAFGQCFEDADCDIVLAAPNASITCEPTIGRCVDPSGTPLAPVLNMPCPDVSFTTRVWDTIVGGIAELQDGLIKVEFPMAPISRTVRGTLRLYLLPVGSPLTVVTDTGFLREQVVNFPCMKYLFRNLAPVPNLFFVYRIAYFDFLGCTVQMDVAVNTAGTFAVPIASTPVPALGFIDFSTTIAAVNYNTLDIDVSADGRRIQFGVPEPVWTGIVEDDLVGPRRVLVGQLFDQGGGVLQTVVGQDLYMDGTLTTGLLFPPFTDNTTFNNFDGPSSLGGRIFFRAVIAFSFVPVGSLDPDADRMLLTDQNGVVEGLELMRIGDEAIISLSDPAGLPPLPPPYANTAGYYTGDGLITTTTYQSTDNPNVYDTLNFAVEPNITFTHVNTFQRESLPQMCLNGTTPGVRISLDYSNFLFSMSFIPATVRIVKINITTADMTETDATATLPVLDIVEFVLTQPGFYCALLEIDLLDGPLFTPPSVGPRRFLRNCFQIPKPMLADAVHVISRFDSLANPADQDGQNIFAGVFTNVDSDFIITLPAVMTIHRTHVVRIQMLRNLASEFQQEITEFLDADVVDVLENPLIDAFAIDFFYDEQVLTQPSQYRVFYLRRSIYHGEDGTYFRLMRPAATLFPDEVARLSFQLYANETIGIPKVNRSIDYECDIMFMLKNLVAPNLQTRIEIEQPLCPNERGQMVAFTIGLFPFQLDNPQYAVDYSSPAPFQNPLAYYYRWRNAEPGHPAEGAILDADLGLTKFSAPPNIRILLETIANNGGVATDFAEAMSIVSEDATVINFLPQEPVCINNTQFVRLSYILGGDTDGAIEYWQPLDVFAKELYNPNVPFFDIPSDCALFALNFTAFEVYNMCQFPVMINTTLCLGCNNLPIARPEVVNGDLITAGNDQFWEVVAWVPTDVFNNATGRFFYCRSGRSIRARVPRPTSLIFTNLRRVLIDPPLSPAVPCQGDACFAVNIAPDVDDFYALELEPQVMFSPDPAFQVIPNAVSMGDPIVRLNTPYSFLVFLDDVLCPSTVLFTPLPRGPQGVVVQASRSDCGAATGKVLIYARYNDPNQAVFGTTRDVCMFWPNRDVLAPAVSALDSFFSFELQVNAPVSTALPFEPDFVLEDPLDERFLNVRGGTHRVLFYDRCPSGNCGNVDCATLVANQETFQLTNPNLAFHVFEFNLTNFQNPAGSIEIQQTRFVDAICYGDTYEISYTVFDGRGDDDIGNPPYEVFFFEPDTGALLATSPICVGNPPVGGVPNELFFNEIDGNQIKLFTFNITIETGPNFGFRPSGNYTLQVRSCKTGCIATFITFIQMVNPIDIIITAVPSNCAFTPGALVRAIAGGTPGNSGQFFSLPGSNVTREAFYTEEWITPFNPTTYIETVLGIRNIPGNYSLRVTDAKGCQAVKNATIPSPTPITATLVGFDAVCAESIQGTFQIRATGGVPPLRTLEGLTQITMGQDISFEFVATLNKTLNFHIIDSVGCILPSPLSFQVPDPGPLPLNLTTTASCADFAGGTVVADVPGGIGVTCQWIANGVEIPALEVCSLEGLPGGTFVRVLATDIQGCQASATASIPTRMPVTAVEQLRTTDGEFGGACTDIIVFDIMGGDFAPPYQLELFNDFSNASLSYAGGTSANITNVCRSVQYTVFIRDGDGQCPFIFFSVDPEFGFGTGQDDSPLGLPFVDAPLFGSIFDTQKKPSANVPIEMFGIVFGGFVVAIIIIIVSVTLGHTRANRGEKNK